MKIIFKNSSSIDVSTTEICNYSLSKIADFLFDSNKQYVFYSEPNYKGKSYFVDGKTQIDSFNKKQIKFKDICSIREFTPSFNDEMLIPSERDNIALQNAVDTWWSDDLKNQSNRINWWKNARFGCFVHWGVYSNCGGQYKFKHSGYTCHIERVAKISHKNYKKDFIDKFNPVEFNAEKWIKFAKDAGMQYFIITAKHHDGFCMYPSKYGYDIRMTPFKDRDPMREIADACRKHNMKFGFYYSHAYDWEHADAPGNDWEYDNYGGTKNLYDKNGKGGWYNEHPEMVERTSKYYVDQKAIPQILELIDNYHPDILWFDTPHKLPLYDNLRILKAIRQKDPNIVVNGRLARCNDYPTLCDYSNNGDRASHIFPTNGYWENIPTTNESYAYNKKDRNHKSPEFFINLISKSVARGGNVLMNIGPMGDGCIEDVDKEILKGIGNWFNDNEESIRNCSKNPLPKQSWGEITSKDNVLYLHIKSVPNDRKIILSGLLNNINSAYILEDRNKTPLTVNRLNYYDNEIIIPNGFSDDNLVVKVIFDGEILVDGGRLLNTKAKDKLLCFDADLIPLSCSHGDGKENQNFVCSFKNKYQQIVWRIRLNETCEYRIKLHYKASNGCGSYVLACDNSSVIRKLKKDILGKMQEDIFEFKIEKGKHDLILAPNEIVGNFAQLFDIELEPIKTQSSNDLIVDNEKIDLGDN